MKFTKLALMFLCSVILFCGCTKNNDVVLKINDKEITHGEFYSDFNKIKESQFKNTPKEAVKDDSYMVLALKERYINDVIVRELLKQEFDKSFCKFFSFYLYYSFIIYFIQKFCKQK